MNPFDHFHDPFLLGLDEQEKTAVVDRLQQWGLHTQLFAARLDSWFCNFDSLDDKRLALKLFHALEYYTPEDFTTRLKQLYGAIERHLADTANDPSDIVLVTPNGAADSADRHAYDIVKQWNLSRSQVLSVSELSQRSFRDPVFVLFNDTHGTGNQFLREIWPVMQHYGEHKIYVLAVAISQKALDSFREHMPQVHVIPFIPVRSALSTFTGAECERLRQIGSRVYPKHPVGYGDAALLTAYYFQCPNNTLPLVWADGENNTVEGNSYSWTPLFPYIPKTEPAQSAASPARRTREKTHSGHDSDSGSRAAPSDAKSRGGLTYRYRVGLLDLDMGLTSLPELASELNICQRFFHFTAPRSADLRAAAAAATTIEGQRNLSVYEIGHAFFEQFDDLAADVIGCFTGYPLAFVNTLDGSIDYNYFSGPSNVDRRFMFISASQLRSFTQAAGCSFEEGLTHILVGQLVVYFTDSGYHKKTSKCPMDFCKVRSDMIPGLKKSEFCSRCIEDIQDAERLRALSELLRWSPA